ncbi:MAG: hypothetical protein WAK17_07915, partial [Candidatus Nitrosopolaris sp.]
VQARLSFCTYFLLYPLVITLQDWSVNHVRNLKCQPCMEAAHLSLSRPSNICKEGGNCISTASVLLDASLQRIVHILYQRPSVFYHVL